MKCHYLSCPKVKDFPLRAFHLLSLCQTILINYVVQKVTDFISNGILTVDNDGNKVKLNHQSSSSDHLLSKYLKGVMVQKKIRPSGIKRGD